MHLNEGLPGCAKNYQDFDKGAAEKLVIVPTACLARKRSDAVP
jgi:hypothetical protein